MSDLNLNALLPHWTLGEPVQHRNLTLVALLGGAVRYDNYLLACEAIGAGLLEVTEMSESGTVPELLAVNRAERPVLLIDGEELQGAKQNRILNTTVLLAPRSKTTIPVSCVEQGRWNHVSRNFKSGHYAPSSLRKLKSRQVHENLRTRGRADSDQGAVWNSVSEHLCAAGAASPTQAMAGAMETMAEVLGAYRRALPYPTGACGVLAADSGRLMALDAFDSPATLEVLWDRLVASYALDAEAGGEKTGHDEPDKPFSDKDAAMVLETLAAQHCQAFDAVALGCDLRFEAAAMHGQGLAVDNRLLHLSAFPPADDRRRGARLNPRFRPPSQRRR